MTEATTMADFRRACEDRLDYAIDTGEEGLERRTGHTDGIELIKFETPAGLELCRFGGMLTVRCDFSELDNDADQREVEIEFFKAEESPEVTEIHSSNRGTDSKSIKRKDHDRIATELSKYLTLIP